MFKAANLKDILTVLVVGRGRCPDAEATRSRGYKILARQVGAAFASVPIIIVSNILILTVLVLTLAGSVPPMHLVLWTIVTLGSAALLLVAWLKYAKDNARDTTRSQFWAWQLEIATVLRGLAWGAGTVAFFPQVDPGRQLVIGLTSAAMMCGGAFAMGALPISAISFILLMGGASVVALILTGTQETMALAALTAVFMAYLWVSVKNQVRIFISNASAEISNREQKQTIGLLLKEFQDNSADWLWHTDADGYFIDPSDRFVAVMGLDAERLQKLRFKDVISLDTSRTNRQAIELLDRRESMTGVEVTLDIGDQRRCWTLTAGPSYDEHQTFVGYRGVASDVTELHAAAARLENLAHFDQLTGLPNRSSFIDELNTEIAGSAPGAVGIVLFDLTGFKLVNDTLGHSVGDELLACLGKRLTGLGASGRTFARFGGDEFALLVKAHPSSATLRSLAQSVFAQFAIPFAIGPHNVVIDASAGIALGGRDGNNAVELLRAADLALYAAKSSGRGHWLEYNADMDNAYLRRQNLERRLREAIDNDELSLRFQPIISIRTGRVSALEALLRWNSAAFGPVGPDEFIPIAEESGLIVPIGNWVLREAIKLCSGCNQGTEVCVNVSPVQLRNKKLVSVVRSCLKSSGLAPERLVLEITEGVFLERSAQTDKILRDLVALGVKIALDDFGTGYSSLSYLRSFPFAKIKIDKSFIDDIAAGGPNALITKAIIDLAAALKFDVVAEGVETNVQLAEIVRLGGGYVQGFLFSKPLTRDELPGFLSSMADEKPLQAEA